MMAPNEETRPLLNGRRISDSGTFSTVDESSIEKSGDIESQGRSTQPEISKQGNLVTIFAVWSSMMGTSLLAMPWAFQQAGLIQGVLLNILLAALSAYTSVLVLRICERFADKETGTMPEFAVICARLLGKCGTILTMLCSIIVFVGAMIVYWILMSELLYNSVNSIHYYVVRPFHSSSSLNVSIEHRLEAADQPQLPEDGNSSAGLLNASTCSDKELNQSFFMPPIPAWSENHTVPFFLVVLFAPLIQLRSASFFTRFGAVGCVPVILLVLYTLVKGVEWGIHADFDDTSSIHHIDLFNNNFPALSGILTMAFFMHNSIVTFFRYAKNPEKNVRNISISYLLVLLTYAAIGISIYLAFPDAKECIKQNFFENISLSDTLSLVAQLALFFRLVTLYPLVGYILRIQIFVPITGKEYPGHLSVASLNVIVVALCVFCAVFYPNIGDIIRYAGAFCGMIYMYLLPCLVDAIVQRKDEARGLKKPNYARYVFHAFLVVIGAGNFFSQFAVTS